MSRLPLCFALLVLVAPVVADTKNREPAGVLKSDSATVLAREKADGEWTPIKKDQEVHSQDLLIGLHDAVVETRSKGVQLRFVSDLSNRSPFPIIETAVRIVPSKESDLDVWLDRGRIDVTNIKEKGSAKVVVRFRTRVWTMVLDKPGTRIAMETYSRWPEGSQFTDKPKQTDTPLQSTLLVVLKGEISRSCSFCTVAMNAPPGPSVFGWDSVHGDDVSPKRLDKLPDWVNDQGPNQEVTKHRHEIREKFRKTVLEKGLGDGLVALLESPDAESRRIGVYALGAFDQLQTLGDLLTRSKDAETWNNAVIALRHWIGRNVGQEQVLYKKLIERTNLSPAHAKIVMQMLMGFTEEERGRPELYSLLIDLLRHEKLAIRGLAYWHLQRLAPKIKVAYNPIGERADWDRSHAEYKEQLTTGKLPPKE